MKEKISNNLLINLFITFTTGSLLFIINKYFAKYLGIDNLGLMKLFSQMVAYLSLAELGISSASAYALYEPLAKKDIRRISSIISTIEFFYNRVMIFVLILGGILSFILPIFLKSVLYDKSVYVYWLLYVINTALSYSFAKYTVLFIANQEYGYVRKIQGMGRILFQILQIYSLIKFKSFIIFILIMILENLYNFYFYNKHYKNKYKYILKIKGIEKSIIKDMKNLFWHKIGGLVVYNTDYLILSKFISLSVVGVYSSYLMIYQIIKTIINIITPVITPRVGNFITNNTKEKIYQYWRELQIIYIFLTTIFIICTYYLINSFIFLWLGKEFILPKITIILILLNLFMELTKIVTDIFKFSCGFFDDTYSPILESIINLVVSLVLVQKIGLNGVILGTSISNFLIIVLLKPILVFKKCFDKNIYIYLKDLLYFYLLVGSCIFLTNIFLDFIKLDLINIFNWIDFVKKSFLLGVLITINVFIIFIFDKKFRKFIKDNIGKKGKEHHN